MKKVSFFFYFLRENLRHNKSLLATVFTLYMSDYFHNQQDLPTPMTSERRVSSDVTNLSKISENIRRFIKKRNKNTSILSRKSRVIAMNGFLSLMNVF